MIRLNINIDHVATLRQARGGNEPDPVAATIVAELAGANGIVCHLREDRRHVQDRDVRMIRDVIRSKMNFEMADNEDIVQIALELVPEVVTIVPEKRQELTTEGGLDVMSNIESLRKLTDRMHEKGIEVSLFIEPSNAQIEAALKVGADMVEFHTGIYANARGESMKKELKRLTKAAASAHGANLQVAAGHGLNYYNTIPICGIKEIGELSIGHSVISRAITTGLDQAVREMKELIHNAEVLR